MDAKLLLNYAKLIERPRWSHCLFKICKVFFSFFLKMQHAIWSYCNEQGPLYAASPFALQEVVSMTSIMIMHHVGPIICQHMFALQRGCSFHICMHGLSSYSDNSYAVLRLSFIFIDLIFFSPFFLKLLSYIESLDLLKKIIMTIFLFGAKKKITDSHAVKKKMKWKLQKGI